jgi:hypothetical protein
MIEACSKCGVAITGHVIDEDETRFFCPPCDHVWSVDAEERAHRAAEAAKGTQTLLATKAALVDADDIEVTQLAMPVLSRGALKMAALGAELPTSYDYALGNEWSDIGHVAPDSNPFLDLRRPALVLDEPKDKTVRVGDVFGGLMESYGEAITALVTTIIESGELFDYMHKLLAQIKRTERHTANARRNRLRRKRKARRRKRG